LNIYSTFESPLLSRVAVLQLEDSVVTYGFVHKILYGELPHKIIMFIGFGFAFVCLLPLLRSVLLTLKNGE